MIESERDLQDYFLKLLENNSFNFIEIKNEDELIANFKKQFELFNNISLTGSEFSDIYNYLINDVSFDKLMEGHDSYSFMDLDDFNSNIFQVSQEITMKSDYTNRYDVTILINGIPIIQVELKKMGVELKEAFNQIKRYDAHTYSGLFSYVQIFVISNNVNTRYFFNDHDFDYDNSFNWFDFNHLDEFTNSFLTIDNLAQLLNFYIYKNPFTDEYCMLRPYQIQAIQEVKKAILRNENGYLWMTYDSGLTLTSFRLADLLSRDFKVVYVPSNNISSYPRKCLAKNKKQFLNFFKRKNFIISHIKNIIPVTDDICDEKVVFIFNDYETNYNRYNPLFLKDKCKNSLFYLFSHSPIFDDNIVLDKTTKYIFDNHIFTYNLKDYYSDNYTKRVNIDIYSDRSDLNRFNLSSDIRIDLVSRKIKDSISSQSILITSSKEDLIKYYNSIDNAVAVFRYNSNDNILGIPAQDHFEAIINDYNELFKEDIPFKYHVNNASVKEKYEKNIIDRFNNGEIELLLIDESMFYDTFDVNILGNLKNPKLNTIFLDCNLKYEALLQVLSMGNIVSFRDIRDDINKTVKLFSNDEPKEDYLLKDYNYYSTEYAHYLSKLKDMKGDFIEEFEKLNENYLIMQTFDEFEFSTTEIEEFNSFKDTYYHKIHEFNSSKKDLTQYDLEKLYSYIIDIDYIKTISKGIVPQIKEINESYSDESVDDNVNDEVNQYVNAETEVEESIDDNEITDFDKSVDDEIKKEDQKTMNYEFTPKFDVQSIRKVREDLTPAKDDFIESIAADLDTKICPECGKEFEREDNFCDSCEDLIKLINKTDLVKECPCCGAKYPEDYNFCVKCHCNDKLIEEPQIKIKEIKSYPNEYYNIKGHTNKFGSIYDLLNENNTYMLQESFLEYDDYEFILSKIKSTYQNVLSDLIKENSINIKRLSLIDKILLLAKSFVIVKYKTGGGDLGNFQYNEINIDDRQYSPSEITTIIHELAHFILAEIFEQAIMMILDTDKTDAIEAFVCEILLKDFNYLVDEYCAHTVEGRFAVLGYQNYGSFNVKADSYPRDAELSIDYACRFGNTFSKGIISILESYINEDLREDIKEEFKKTNEQPNYEGLKYETTSCLDNEDITSAINIMINYGIQNCNVDKLEIYTEKFKKNNSKG